MKNGINVAATSEIVNEICEVPEEADIRYKVTGTWAHGLSGDLRIGTVKIGTIRHARDFDLRYDLPVVCGGRERHPSPTEFLLSALAGCVMTIITEGASLKGLTIMSLEIDAYAMVEEGIDGAELDDFVLLVKLEAEGNKSQHEDILENVKIFSPNFITINSSNAISINTLRAAPAVEFVPAEKLEEKVDTFIVNEHSLARQHKKEKILGPTIKLRWRNGFQFDSASEIAFAKQCPGAFSNRFAIDQPVQFGGLDEAPNPQEYLLSALASDITQCILKIALKKKYELETVEVDCRGTVDLRGLLNVKGSEPVVVKVSEIEADVRIAGNIDSHDLSLLVRNACEMSAVCRTLALAQKIDLRLG